MDDSLAEHGRYLLTVLPDAPDTRGRLIDQGDDLAMELAKIRRSLELPRSLLHKIPNQLLFRIFQEACALSGSHINNWGLKTAFGISHTSRRWREVAISTPSLWTTVNVHPQKRGSYERMKTCFARSHGLPLSVNADLAARPSVGQTQVQTIIGTVQHAYLVTILAEGHRIRELKLELQDEQQRTTVVECLKNLEMPELEIFVMQVPQRENIPNKEADNSASVEVLLGGAPSLRTVQLVGCAFQACYMPLQTVTTLVLSIEHYVCSHQELQRLLLHAESLRDLSLSGYTIQPPQEGASDIVTEAPHLVTLRVTPQSAGLCEYLSAPALRTLTVDSASNKRSYGFLESWKRTDWERYPSLEELIPLRVNFKARDWEQLFELIPQLRRLKVSNHAGYAHNVLAALTVAGRVLLPSLERIAVPTLPKHILLDLIESRGGPGGALRILECNRHFVQALEGEHPNAVAWMAKKGVILEEPILQSGFHGHWKPSVEYWGEQPAPWLNEGVADDDPGSLDTPASG